MIKQSSRLLCRATSSRVTGRVPWAEQLASRAWGSWRSRPWRLGGSPTALISLGAIRRRYCGRRTRRSRSRPRRRACRGQRLGSLARRASRAAPSAQQCPWPVSDRRRTLVIEVNPSVPTRTLASFIAYAGANPGKLRIGFAGVGTPQHIGIEMFKAMADVDMTLVPYLGLGSTPALAHLLAGKIDAMFDPMPSSIAPIRAERLIPLAVTTPAKSDALPNVPSASDLVAGYQAGSWFGIVAPHQTPAALVERLNAAVNAAFRDPGMKARMAELRASLLPGSVTQFHAFIQSETVRYAEVIRSADISAK